jgi:hypothetical protein
VRVLVFPVPIGVHVFLVPIRVAFYVSILLLSLLRNTIDSAAPVRTECGRDVQETVGRSPAKN